MKNDLVAGIGAVSAMGLIALAGLAVFAGLELKKEFKQRKLRKLK